MITIIVAFDENRLIGVNNKMPWFLKSDLKHFRNTTINHSVIMGRKTFDSIGKTLDNRHNIIVSNTLNINDSYDVANNIDEAIELAKSSEVFIIGGASIYEQTIKLADKLIITHIHHEFNGDTFFPKINYDLYDLIKEETILDDEYPYTIKEYLKKPIH